MDPLRKYDSEEDSLDLTYSYGDMHGTSSPLVEQHPQRVYDDLSAETIAQLQADANEHLAGEEWTLIDGYGG